MRQLNGLLALVSLIGGVAVAGDVRAQEPAETDRSIASIGWLAGCWTMSRGSTSVEEHWMPPKGRTMLGVNRTVREDETSSYEFLMIREAGAELLYEAYPSGQAPTAFEATVTAAAVAVFENPRHDFPRRIAYFRLGTDSLRAEADDGQGGGRIEFLFRRTECGR